MKTIIKTLSLLSIMAVIPGAMAATSRVSTTSKVSPRLPSIAGYIMTSNSSTTTGSLTGTTYLADVDCIDNYSSCIKGSDACGSDFEECTNSVLLHAKMPTCLSVLSQCSAAGRTSLFGTSDLSAIATSATKNTDGEVTAYTYPTASSVLGQMITAAQIENQLSTDQCVKKYSSCLHKENVCGADFELCTDKKEFKKQAMACDATLARCQSAGKTELFGSTAAAASLQPTTDSRLGEMIAEGAALAVNNAVATCNKVTDQCFLNACNKNPNKCIVDRPEILIRISDATKGGRAVTTQDLMEISKITEKRDVADYIRQECKQTIGSNKFCYMTVKGKPVTKESVLSDPDNVDEVFNDMYSGEFGRFAALSDKINQIVDNFDAKVQEKCVDTISSCAMRSCGSGIGSVCYKQSRDTDGSVNQTKSPKSYKELKSACRAIVDTDANCQYAAVLSKGTLYSGYMNDESSVFTTLYPEDSLTGDDPIGVIASLNATLATSYNDAAIENMKKQCQTTALGCVRSLCGKDFVNCYRNRTDIVAGTYDTGNSKLDRSMNKMGGILDYNIVIGLCMNTVKTSSVCEEHLKVAAADWRLEQDTNSWADGTTVRNAWLDANTTKINKNANDVLIACAISSAEAQTKDNCVAYDRAEPNANGTCDGVMDEDGCLYTEPVYQNSAEYVLENAGKTLFQELLADVEREVQAKYNAKLTKEQNICLAQNVGGIKGSSDNGSTFMWVKLKNNKVPKAYNTKGLTTKQFTASNDLYGSFCRARITVTSDDKAVQEVLAQTGESTAYFAVGDAFTCGSWISQNTLNKITKVVGDKARRDAGEGSAAEGRDLMWTQLIGTLVGGAGGYIGTNALQNNGLLGGVSKATTGAVDDCLSKVDSARKSYNRAIESADVATQSKYYTQAVDYANSALSAAKRAGVTTSMTAFQTSVYRKAVAGSEAVEAKNAVYAWDNEDKLVVDTAIDNLKNHRECLDLCRPVVEEVETLLKDATPSEQTGVVIYSKLKDAKEKCNLDSKGNPTVKCENIIVLNGPMKIKLVSDAVQAKDKVEAVAAGWDSEMANFSTKLNTLEDSCKEARNKNENKNSNKVWKNVAGAAVGGLAGNMLAYRIAKTTKEAGYDSAANNAINEWMSEVGDHIQCYIGSEELGSYGDTIAFTIEE